MDDGDLWEWFQKAAINKGPKWIKLKKVKGHATWEMVESGLVPIGEKCGNDEADKAADKGAMKEDVRLSCLAENIATSKGCMETL